MAITDNLVALWQNGSLVDATGRGNDLTAVSSVPSVASGLSGIPNALSFDGSNYATRISTADLVLNETDFSISIWIKVDESCLSTGADILVKENTFFYLSDYPVYTLDAYSTILISDLSYVVDTNYHLIIIKQISGTTTIIIDGVLQDDEKYMPVEDIGSDLYVGMAWAFSGLIGQIAQLAIYKRALTAEEITYLYNEGNGRLITLAPVAETNLSTKIYNLLISNSEIVNHFKNKIFPIVVPEGVKIPAITYNRSGMFPNNTKDKYSTVWNDRDIQITVYAKSYSLAETYCDLVETVLIRYTDINFKSIKLTDELIDFDEDFTVQGSSEGIGVFLGVMNFNVVTK